MSRQKIAWIKMIKKLSPYTIRKGILYLRHYGPKEFALKFTERFEASDVDYQKWFLEHRVTPEKLAKQREKRWREPVVISIIVPVYKTPEVFLRQLILSVREQSYPYWELCFADGGEEERHTEEIIREYQRKDKRIRYQRLEKNMGISENTNAAIRMATGEYVALLDHDDLLEADALYEIAKEIRKKKVDILYTDEDKITADGKEYFQPHFKPDFSLDLLRSNNYICHLFVARREIAQRVGGLRKEFDGAQDYDFIFQCVENSERIGHVPKVLYHWRTHRESTADNPASKLYAFEAGKRAIEQHLKRVGVEAEVFHTKDYGFYRVKYRQKGDPLVSILIPNKDQLATLKKCLESIWKLSTYRNIEILIVENNSEKKETFQYYKEIDGKKKVRVLYFEGAFNYSKINNYGVAHAKGEYVICLNNDMEVITPDWIEELLSHCQRKEVGVVGARLYYPDHTIQHAGIVIGMGGIAGSMFVGMDGRRSGYLHKAAIQQDMSAVTAACMMVKKHVFQEVNGFEEKLAVAFNDVDFCLKVREKGYLIVYDPYVELYHDESKTRGAEDTKEKVRRFQGEIEYMRTRWMNLLKQGDPYYNPNLSLKKWDYSIRP